MIENKINLARRIIDEIFSAGNITKDTEMVHKLQDMIEKAELYYNDLKIKQFKSEQALIAVTDIENKIDLIIREIENIKNINVIQ